MAPLCDIELVITASPTRSPDRILRLSVTAIIDQHQGLDVRSLAFSCCFDYFSKVAMADIYLKHHHDKHAYARCYMELVELRPDAQTHIMLGEAFMQIQDPEQVVGPPQHVLKHPGCET
eukprot:scaffold563722_cov31-Prasinocladus_malaysianus.AAC.1